jgi:hypothetical protein
MSRNLTNDNICQQDHSTKVVLLLSGVRYTMDQQHDVERESITRIGDFSSKLDARISASFDDLPIYGVRYKKGSF